MDSIKTMSVHKSTGMVLCTLAQYTASRFIAISCSTRLGLELKSIDF